MIPEPQPRDELLQPNPVLAIDFGTAGNFGEHRRTGWADSEPRHTWTIGPESRLELSVPEVPGPYRMVIELGPFVSPPALAAQRLQVLINGCAGANTSPSTDGTDFSTTPGCWSAKPRPRRSAAAR